MANVFMPPYGNSFRQSGIHANNEVGVYIGATWLPIIPLKIDGFCDFFYFLRPQHRLDVPAHGQSWLLKATYQFNRLTYLLLQYKGINSHKNQAKEERNMGSNRKIVPYNKGNYKLKLQYTTTHKISFTSQGQYSNYATPKIVTSGYAFAQDIGYTAGKVQLHGRIVYFLTDNYTSLFFYEKDILYSGIHFVPYQGRGVKYCFITCYKPIMSLRMEIKYTLTKYNKIANDVIAQSKSSLPEGFKNEIKLQIMYSF